MHTVLVTIKPSTELWQILQEFYPSSDLLCTHGYCVRTRTHRMLFSSTIWIHLRAGDLTYDTILCLMFKQLQLCCCLHHYYVVCCEQGGGPIPDFALGLHDFQLGLKSGNNIVCLSVLFCVAIVLAITLLFPHIK